MSFGAFQQVLTIGLRNGWVSTSLFNENLEQLKVVESDSRVHGVERPFVFVIGVVHIKILLIGKHVYHGLAGPGRIVLGLIFVEERCTSIQGNSSGISAALVRVSAHFDKFCDDGGQVSVDGHYLESAAWVVGSLSVDIDLFLAPVKVMNDFIHILIRSVDFGVSYHNLDVLLAVVFGHNRATSISSLGSVPASIQFNVGAVKNEINFLLLELVPSVLEVFDELVLLVDLGGQVVPNNLRNLAARMVRLALDGLIPTLLNDKLGFEDSRLNVVTEGLHDFAPLVVKLVLDDELIFLTALGTGVASGKKDTTLSLSFGKGGGINLLAVLIQEGLGNGGVPAIKMGIGLLLSSDGVVVGGLDTAINQVLLGSSCI